MRQPAQETIDAADEDSDVLSPDEIRAAIEGFSHADWIRLKRAAAYFAWRPGVQGSDLQQEAMMRALEGRRKCPRKTSVITFLCGAIRSIASEGDSEFQQVSIEDQAEFSRNDEAKLRDASRDPYREAQGRIDGERLMAEVLGLFDDDEKAEMLFEGMMVEMEGEELREFLELTQTEFDSKRRLVRRRLNQHFEGRKND